jgi:hypothetical protein
MCQWFKVICLFLIDVIFMIEVFSVGCCKAEFDSTYPIHLNGIISQGEFQESIEKINRTVSAGGARKIITIIYLLSILISMVCFIFGGIGAGSSRTYGFPPLIAAGIGISIVGTFLFIIIIITVQVRQVAQMRQAIAEESMKYSARSPTPCSWRLETTRYFGGYGNNNSQVSYHVNIII